MNRSKIILTVSLIALVLIVIGFAVLNKPIVPSAITAKANYVIFYPTPTKESVLQKTSFKYSTELKQVSFLVKFNGKNMTFAEQASPDAFADDPNYFSQFIDKLNKYQTFDSLFGTVYLTLPSKTGNQTAVMNTKGTLLFVQATDGALSSADWKKLFIKLDYAH